jgi:PAS domain S-box-containing protein
MQEDKKVKDQPAYSSDSGLPESAEKLPQSTSQKVAQLEPIDSCVSTESSTSQHNHTKSSYACLSMFHKNITESGSFQIPTDWLDAFWSILQALPMPALLIDRSLCIVFANDACQQIVGSEENLQDRLFSSLFSESGEAREAERIAKEVYTANTPQSLDVEFLGLRKRILARLHYRSLRLTQDRTVLVLIEDLTADREKLEFIERQQEELLKARDELDRTNARLRREMEEHAKVSAKIEQAKTEWERTFDAVPDLISIVDTDHRIVRVNKALADKLGKTYDDIVGTHCYETVHNSDKRHIICPHSKLIRDGQPHRAEVADDQLGGIFDIAVSPIFDGDGRVIGAVHIARDITDEKKAQQHLLASGRARVVAELASMVAHSFNNLLQTAMGGAQLSLTNLELGNFSDIKNTLEEIIEDLRQGARTVKRLNFLAQAFSESTIFGEKALDLSAAVHQALDMCSPWWKTLPDKAGIGITLKRDLGPNCFVRGDRNKLLEVVVDLVKNATEALPEGGIIDIRTCLEGNWVALRVRDNGVGIPQEHLNEVFKPLWTTKGPASAGLGLERVHNTVKRHNGKITIDSKIGHGTTVTILLPREDMPDEEIPTTILDEPGPECRILLVDDNEPILKMLARNLEQMGHKVFSCLSGKRALNVFSASQFDLVISDLGMPDMNGWQVAEALKQIAEKKDQSKTPFILLTGWGGQTRLEEIMAKSGVDAVIEKPVDIIELSKVIRRFTCQVSPESECPI